MAVFLTMFGAFSTVLLVAVWIFTAICWYKVFEKANEKGWKAFIPFYEKYITYKIAGQQQWFIVYMIAWFVSQVLSKISSVALVGELMIALSNGAPMSGRGFVMFWSSVVLSVIVFGVNLYICFKIAERFGKSKWFGAGIAILPIVFVPILAFGTAVYDDKEWI